MWTTFVEMGFIGKTTVVLHSVFSETWNTIRMSPTIHLEAFKQTDGVWQGSSPSTLLASLVFEKFIRKMNLTYPSGHESTPVTEAGDPVNVLAFCDDLVIISKTWKGL